MPKVITRLGEIGDVIRKHNALKGDDEAARNSAAPSILGDDETNSWGGACLLNTSPLGVGTLGGCPNPWATSPRTTKRRRPGQSTQQRGACEERRLMAGTAHMAVPGG